MQRTFLLGLAALASAAPSRSSAARNGRVVGMDEIAALAKNVIAAAALAQGVLLPRSDGPAVTVFEYPVEPIINFEAPGSSSWEFAYNPASPVALSNGRLGLIVRVQNGSAPPGHCGTPLSTSYLAGVELGDDGNPTGPLGPTVVFQAANTTFEQDVEDPRIVQMGTKHYMTYTANGAGRAPLNRHQGIASSTAPMQPGSWTRLCTEDSPCLPAGVKSGAMLPLPGGGGIMFCYDLRNKSRNTIVARSDDLVHWRLTGQILLPRRQSMWDAGLIEPGPPPMRLSNGQWLFFYNGATEEMDRQYHVGWAVLDADDPSKVVHRSPSPLLSWTDRPWMVGNSSAYICYTPTVVFCNSARKLALSDGAGPDAFELFFGGADAVVGRARVKVALST